MTDTTTTSTTTTATTGSSATSSVATGVSIEVFDPAMCCPTGVCGPAVEPGLARFEADLRWATKHGATVVRHNLAQEPGAFVDRPVVAAILASGGEEALPVVMVDGKLRWSGSYPSRDDLATVVTPDTPARALDAAVPAGGLLPLLDADAQGDADACCSPAEAAGGCC